MPAGSSGIMLGVAFAFMSAFFFGLNSVVARIAGQRFSERIMLPTSLFIGLLLSSSFLVADATTLTLSAVAAYVFSGVANFGIARFFFFKAVRRIGAGTTALIISGNVIMTALLSALLLGETPGVMVLLGLVFFLIGVVVASYDDVGGFRDVTGLASAFLAMMFVAMVNISIRYANLGASSPFIGVFISYLAAFVFIAVARSSDTRSSLKTLVDRRDWSLALLGIIPLIAQTSRFLSLDYMPAYLAAPIFSTSTFFALIVLSLTPSARERVGLKKFAGVVIGFIGIVVSILGY